MLGLNVLYIPDQSSCSPDKNNILQYLQQINEYEWNAYLRWPNLSPKNRIKNKNNRESADVCFSLKAQIAVSSFVAINKYFPSIRPNTRN